MEPIPALIDKQEFVGLEQVVHLSAGGETPMLASHRQVFEEFMRDKAGGERARALEADKVEATRALCAELLSAQAEDITFLSSASDGINAVMYGLQWQAGDNVVIADVEFASGIYPWTRLQHQGVEIRVVKHRDWVVSLDDIAAQIDDQTRIVLISHVSMFTGQRIDLARLSALVRGAGARLVLDATHAAGVVEVDATLADVVVSSCYKWLLGVHGCAIFYWNRDTFPELEPAMLGWNSVASGGGWPDPLQFTLKPDAHQFQPANPPFLGVYLLHNGLSRLLSLGMPTVEAHALALTERLHRGIQPLGFELMTPAAEAERGGNVCIMTDKVDETAAALRQQDILVWGTYAADARLRISTHVFNSSEDVDACVDALASVAVSSV